MLFGNCYDNTIKIMPEKSGSIKIKAIPTCGGDCRRRAFYNSIAVGQLSPLFSGFQTDIKSRRQKKMIAREARI
jgi:hypothetical protein